MKPYYQDSSVSLYLGDMREVLPGLFDAMPDACFTDPPYGDTSLGWDSWPSGWPQLVPTR